jgi:hypothetical protein
VSFHFGWGDVEAEEEVNFILMGLVSSWSEKRFEDAGERMLA